MQLKSILGLCAAAALVSAPLVHAAGEQSGGAYSPGSAQQGAQPPGAADQQAFEGEHSDAVLQVQEALNSQGYSAGPEDGILGPQTRSALTEFQQSEGMQASGDIDRDTISALGLDPEDSEFAAFVETEEDADPGMQDPGMQDPGMGDPGMGDPGMQDGGMMRDDPMTGPDMR